MASKRGRPPKTEGAKRSAIAVRTTEHTKNRIAAVAGAAGRSLTQEIEQRLEWSLAFEDELGGADGLALHRQIAWAIRQTERRTGSRWTDNPTAYWATLGAIEAALEEFQPPYTGERGRLVDDLYMEKERAQLAYDGSYTELLLHFPTRTAPTGLRSLGPGDTFKPQSIPDFRYDRLMSDGELDEVVAGMDPDLDRLVRLHQQNLRELRMAEQVWKNEMQALLEQENQERARARYAVRQLRRELMSAPSAKAPVDPKITA